MKSGYCNPVKFSSTGRYGCGPADEDDVYTVSEFKTFVEKGLFIDFDGFGYPVKDGLADPSIIVEPSQLSAIPKDATHIVWFNK